MLKNFLRVRVQIYTDLCSRGNESIFPTEAEIQHVKRVTDALDIIAFASTKLGARDVNLAKADQILEFALWQLDQLNTEFSKELRKNVFQRVTERRQKELSTLLGYLDNHKFLDRRTGARNLPYSTKSKATETAESLYKRLFYKEPDPPTIEEEV